jgi:hypothetical protein
MGQPKAPGSRVAVNYFGGFGDSAYSWRHTGTAVQNTNWYMYPLGHHFPTRRQRRAQWAMGVVLKVCEITHNHGPVQRRWNLPFMVDGRRLSLPNPCYFMWQYLRKNA